jgi:hypothetical protein
MSGTQAIYYRDRHGRQPVEEFIDGLPPRHQAAVDLAIDRSRNLFVLLHMLRKNTGRLPALDVEIAQTRWKDFKARMDAQPRRPPRVAGDDAP